MRERKGRGRERGEGEKGERERKGRGRERGEGEKGERRERE